jgi:hypothetical protein
MRRRKSTTNWNERLMARKAAGFGGPHPHFENCHCSDCTKQQPVSVPPRPGSRLTAAEAYAKDARDFRDKGLGSQFRELICGMLKGNVIATLNLDGTTEYELSAKCLVRRVKEQLAANA